MVEYDGNADALFSLRRKNKKGQWLVFTRGIIEKLVSFLVSARSTYTAATRHLSSDVRSFRLRRQDVVKLGTAAIRTFAVPPETARCPTCGPNPEFVVIDGQALGCSDPDDVNPIRPSVNCPVLDIPAPMLCVLPDAPLRAAIDKVLRGTTPLTATQERLLRDWASQVRPVGRHSPAAAGAYVFFRFFPLGDDPTGRAAGKDSERVRADADRGDDAEVADDVGGDEAALRKKGQHERVLEEAVREDDDGNLVLGGKGCAPKKPAETWRDRKGLCVPNFNEFPREDDGLWICVRPFLQAFLTEGLTGMFQSHDERAVRLFANTLRLGSGSAWREMTEAVDGVGFVASFIGCVGDSLEADRRLRLAVGELLLRAVDVEQYADKEFEKEANKQSTKDRGWRNAEYCARWNKRPTPADYKKWRTEQEELGDVSEDDPLVCFEHFPSLPRVRPGIRDSEAETRRVGYKGKDKHVADVEGDGDACNKAFSIKAGLSQGVFNVVCPHVITLGFRCMFRAESVGEALSVVLERFPKLPSVIFYDVACKMDKNALRRVRPILRCGCVRCILDRPHSITHTCSPIYMPDESLGKTAGVTTQAAEVAHSIAVGNRTSLAYMHPTTYMTHRIIQVAFQNVRKLNRLFSGNPKSENDHVPLSSFFHSRIAGGCARGSACTCSADKRVEATQATTEPPVAEPTEQGGQWVDGPADAVPDVIKELQPTQPTQLQGPAPHRGSHNEVACAVAADSAGQDNRAVPATAAPGARHDCTHEGIEALEQGRRTRAADGDAGESSSRDGSRTSEPEAEEITDDTDVDERRNPGLAERSNPPEMDCSALWEDAEAQQGAGSKHVEWVSTQALTPEQEQFVANLTAGRDGACAVRPRNKANIVLLVADFWRLHGERWLNGELMNSFIALINARDSQRASSSQLDRVGHPGADALTTPRTRMFGTYFFSRLVPMVGAYDYDGVRRWGAGLQLDLAAVDIILIPINQRGNHWTLVEVNVQDQYFRYYDPFGVTDDGGYVNAVRRWLVDELRSTLGESAVLEWSVDEWQVPEDADLPRQADGGSCGVFVLIAALYLSEGKALTFSQGDVDVLRQRIAIALYLDELYSVSPAVAPAVGADA